MVTQKYNNSVKIQFIASFVNLSLVLGKIKDIRVYFGVKFKIVDL